MTRLRSLAVLLLVLAACGDSAMTADEYFTELAAARGDFTQANQDVADRYEAQLASSFAELGRQFDLEDPDQADEVTARALEVAIEAATTLVTVRVEGLERYLGVLDELRPPDSAAEAHAASLVGLREARDGLTPTLDAIRAVEDVGGIPDALVGSPLGMALIRVREACRALQGIAATEGLVVDLLCPAN